MPNFKQVIDQMKKKEIAEERPQSNKHRITQTYLDKVGDDWKETNREVFLKDKDYVDRVLTDTIQPFESSHKLYKSGKGKAKFDTYETISPDGNQMVRWFVEYPGEFKE